MTIAVEGTEIDVFKKGEEDYISLTKMVKGFGGNTQIQNWVRLKDTIMFLGYGKAYITLILILWNSTELKLNQGCSHIYSQ